MKLNRQMEVAEALFAVDAAVINVASDMVGIKDLAVGFIALGRVISARRQAEHI